MWVRFSLAANLQIQSYPYFVGIRWHVSYFVIKRSFKKEKTEGVRKTIDERSYTTRYLKTQGFFHDVTRPEYAHPQPTKLRTSKCNSNSKTSFTWREEKVVKGLKKNLRSLRPFTNRRSTGCCSCLQLQPPTKKRKREEKVSFSKLFFHFFFKLTESWFWLNVKLLK